jgi:hypothetical protein
MAAASAAAIISFGGLGASDGTQPDVTVREEGGVYSVRARFDVPQPIEIVKAVLTDYEAIPRFLPQIKRSTVLSRTPGHAMVEQEADSQFMMFSKRIHLVLDITESPETIAFRDRANISFEERYHGLWCLHELETGTQVDYDLVADPSFDVPSFVLKRLLKRDSTQTIENLEREMAARASGRG